MDAQRRLSEFLFAEKEACSWPGTQLHGSRRAIVSHYELNPDSAKILAEIADGLYQWQQPQLPEDLCILRQDGTPWLVSIAHESDAYLELTRDEKAQLADDLPALGELLE